MKQTFAAHDAPHVNSVITNASELVASLHNPEPAQVTQLRGHLAELTSGSLFLTSEDQQRVAQLQQSLANYDARQPDVIRTRMESVGGIPQGDLPALRADISEIAQSTHDAALQAEMAQHLQTLEKLDALNQRMNRMGSMTPSERQQLGADLEAFKAETPNQSLKDLMDRDLVALANPPEGPSSSSSAPARGRGVGPMAPNLGDLQSALGGGLKRATGSQKSTADPVDAALARVNALGLLPSGDFNLPSRTSLRNNRDAYEADLNLIEQAGRLAEAGKQGAALKEFIKPSMAQSLDPETLRAALESASSQTSATPPERQEGQTVTAPPRATFNSFPLRSVGPRSEQQSSAARGRTESPAPPTVTRSFAGRGLTMDTATKLLDDTIANASLTKDAKEIVLQRVRVFLDKQTDGPGKEALQKKFNTLSEQVNPTTKLNVRSAPLQSPPAESPASSSVPSAAPAPDLRAGGSVQPMSFTVMPLTAGVVQTSAPKTPEKRKSSVTLRQAVIEASPASSPFVNPRVETASGSLVIGESSSTLNDSSTYGGRGVLPPMVLFPTGGQPLSQDHLSRHINWSTIATEASRPRVIDGQDLALPTRFLEGQQQESASSTSAAQKPVSWRTFLTSPRRAIGSFFKSRSTDDLDRS